MGWGKIMQSRFFRFAVAGVLALIFTMPVQGAEQDARSFDLARLATTGTLTGSNQDRARESMVDLAGNLQALYDIGGRSEEPDADVLEEIQERSEDLGEAVATLLDFVNRIRAQEEDAAPSIPDEAYDRRTLRMVNTYLDLVDPLTEFANGESLEGEALDQIGAGLMRIEALTLALPGTEF